MILAISVYLFKLREEDFSGNPPENGYKQLVGKD